MRSINSIILHCTATPPKMDIGVKEVRTWHLRRKFTDIGYHYVIRRDGTVEQGRPVEIKGAHAKGHNSNSIGISYVGGVDEKNQPTDTRTGEQKIALKALVEGLKGTYPGVEIIGHNKVAAKACPCFDVEKEF